LTPRGFRAIGGAVQAGVASGSAARAFSMAAATSREAGRDDAGQRRAGDPAGGGFGGRGCPSAVPSPRRIPRRRECDGTTSGRSAASHARSGQSVALLWPHAILAALQASKW